MFVLRGHRAKPSKMYTPVNADERQRTASVQGHGCPRRLRPWTSTAWHLQELNIGTPVAPANSKFPTEMQKCAQMHKNLRGGTICNGRKPDPAQCPSTDKHKTKQLPTQSETVGSIQAPQTQAD